MKSKFLFLIFLLHAHSFALSIGETKTLPIKIVKTGPDEQVMLEPNIRVVGENRTYEAFYDLRNKEMTDKQVFEEIKEIFFQEKNSILELHVDRAEITAFVADYPACSGLFKEESDWQPLCIKHE